MRNPCDLLTLQVGIMDGKAYAYQTWTYAIGDVAEDDERPRRTGLEALRVAVAKAVAGTSTEDVSRAIDERITAAGFTANRDFVGHGMGLQLHEPP